MNSKPRIKKLPITNHQSPITKVVEKPWGKEIWFAYTQKYVGKIILINKGHRLSKQYHRFKHETLYTDKGEYLLELSRFAGRFAGSSLRSEKKKIMKEGSIVVIPPKTVHRLEAKFGNVKIIEVSTPQVKDVIRLEDDYGRKR